MKILFRHLIILALPISCLLSTNAYAALEDVCPATRQLQAIKYKAIPSDHITTGPRVGGLSLIYKRGTKLPAIRCLTIYDAAGNLLAKLGKYEPNGGEFGARYYSGTGCAGRARAGKIAAKAFTNAGSRAGYIAVGGGACLVVKDLRRDEGSVR